jgi:hypothetical protein
MMAHEPLRGMMDLQPLRFPPAPLRVALLLYLAFVVSGCGGSEATVSVVAVTSGPVTQFRSAALDSVSGPRVDSIARVTNLTGEAPDPTVHDLLVASARDGAHPAVKAFRDAGKTVVFLNADVATKRSLTPIIATVDSSAFAVRQERDSLELLDWPVAAGDDAAFERELTSYLTEESNKEELRGRSQTDAWIPPAGLVYASFSYRLYPPQPQVFHSSHGVQSQVPQVPLVKAHYQFRLFLVKTDNGNPDALDLSAKVLVGANIEMAPFDPNIGLDSLLVNGPTERAWIPVGMTLKQESTYPKNRILQSGPPTSQSNAGPFATALDVPLTFYVNYPSTATKTFSTNAVRDLTNWQVQSAPAGTEWTYTSSDPYSGTNPALWSGTGFGGGLDVSGLRLPNAQQLGTLKTSSQIVYGNGGLLGKTSFTGKLKLQFANIYLDSSGNVGHKLASPSELNLPFEVDLSVINPPEMSLTFSPNPLNGADYAVGTVTLTSPARTPIVVAITSTDDGTNFQFPTSVTIPAGATSATFGVVVEARNTPSGGTVFYVAAGKTFATPLDLFSDDPGDT